jgi:glycosyltransferase involved in cell wall biosynthesis
MQNHFPLYVLSSDHDFGVRTPYPGISSGVWLPFQHTTIQVLYANARQINAWRMLQYIRQARPAYLYLNSMFSLYFSLFPLLFFRLGLIQAKVVLAPRGMLKSSALQFKARKKGLFLHLFRWSGLSKRITFHATDEQEKADIQRVFGASCRIQVIPNFPAPVATQVAHKVKHQPTRFVFLGRVHPIKNLHLAITAFQACSLPAELFIIGSTEDMRYWKLCLQMIAELPTHLQVHYLGELPHPQVSAKLPKFDFLLLPTQGENFGHAIFECFAAGLPVIISDQTPWKDLQHQQIGWSLPLDQLPTYAQAIEQAAMMSQEQYIQWSTNAQEFAQEFVQKAGLKAAYLQLFS